MKFTILFSLAASLLLLSCQGKNTSGSADSNHETQASPAVRIPPFSADSAYRYIAEQVAFGPRVPGTEAHSRCVGYLAAELRRHGAQVTRQQAEVTRYDGTPLAITNLVGSFQPENPSRILLMAHWDSRPWADADPDPENHRKPIPGANDGASGVGVLLEIARLIAQDAPRLGVDILFFDAEDAGTPQWDKTPGENDESTWCLGSQYWAAHPHQEDYTARFGILLDMVGGRGATFYQEGYSLDYAAPVVAKIWSQAAALGHSQYFPDQPGGYVTDDHLPINRSGRLPVADIVPYDRENGGFCTVWHTMADDLSFIDPATLRAVGETVAAVVWQEE